MGFRVSGLSGFVVYKRHAIKEPRSVFIKEPRSVFIKGPRNVHVPYILGNAKRLAWSRGCGFWVEAL